MAAAGIETMVVDADVYGGSIAQMLGILDEASGLLAATRAANTGALDAPGLARHAREVGPRLRVLSGLPRADRWVEAKSVLVRAVLSTARELAEVTVVDTGFSLELDEEISYDTAAPRRNGATIEVLERADAVVVVGRADPVGLGRLIRALGELSTAIPECEPLVVVNRLRGDSGWSRDEIAETTARTTGLTPLGWLPDDPGACDKAVIQGATLAEAAPTSKLAKALRQLAMELAGADMAARRSAASRRPRLRGRRGARAR
jgi:MinD-like ATPase involved in chromosome partitioning or flagellar assembly